MNRWRLAMWVLILALIAILATGFYLGATHQEPRPDNDGSPAVTQPQG
jgi:Ni,Fe-hydrogenase I cytochrome b subunit